MFSYYSKTIFRLFCLLMLDQLQGIYSRVSNQWSSSADHSLSVAHLPLRCFSCTTLDANTPLDDVQDMNWRQWMESVRYVSRTPDCADPSEYSTKPSLWGGSRSSVKTTYCDGGMCLKMWYRDAEDGREHAWRSCIANSAHLLQAECTRIIGSQGQMEVCICKTSLCNGGGDVSTSSSSTLFHNRWHLTSSATLTVLVISSTLFFVLQIF